MSDFTAQRRGRVHKEDVGGTALPLEAPRLVSVAGEERSRNGMIFFFLLCCFSLNLGCMLALDLASQNPYLLQGHPLQSFPVSRLWPGLPGYVCPLSLGDTDPLPRHSPALLVYKVYKGGCLPPLEMPCWIANKQWMAGECREVRVLEEGRTQFLGVLSL